MEMKGLFSFLQIMTTWLPLMGINDSLNADLNDNIYINVSENIN